MFEIKYLEDCPECSRILAGWSYDEWNRTRGLSVDLLERAYRDRARKDSIPLTFVAFENNIPVGMVSIRQNELWSRKDLNPWLASLYVIPEFRKRSIGTQLIRRVLYKAEEMGICRMYIFLDKKEKDMLEVYYSKRGWQYLADATDNDGNITGIMFYDM